MKHGGDSTSEDTFDRAVNAYELGDWTTFEELFEPAVQEFPVLLHYLGELEFSRGNDAVAELWWARSSRRRNEDSFSRLQALLAQRTDLDDHRMALVSASEYSYLVDPALDFVIAELEQELQ
jgi:hypothetical protein